MGFEEEEEGQTLVGAPMNMIGTPMEMIDATIEIDGWRSNEGDRRTNENNGWRCGTGLLEQVSDAGRRHTGKHLYKLSSVGGVEGDSSLARHGFCQVRLPGAWRPLQEHALQGHCRIRGTDNSSPTMRIQNPALDHSTEVSDKIPRIIRLVNRGMSCGCHRTSFHSTTKHGI